MHIDYINNQQDWNKWLPRGVHFLQSYAWGQLKVKGGSQPVYAAYSADGSKPLYIVLLLIKKVGPFRIGYTPRGPIAITAKEIEPKQVLAFMETLAREQSLDTLVIDPPVFLDSPEGKEWGRILSADRRYKLTRQVQSRGTAVTKLSEVPAIFERLDKRTRYNIRLPEKRGVEIAIEPATSVLMKKFYDLYTKTGSSKGFAVYGQKYYQNLLAEFDRDPKVQTYFGIATHKDATNPLGMAFLVHSGEQFWYLYATSGNEMRNLMPNYALQWHCLQFAKKLGAKTYDWWGAPFDKHNKKDPLYTVWHFKRSFLPEHKQLVGAYSYRPPGLKSILLNFLEAGRNTFLAAKKYLVSTAR